MCKNQEELDVITVTQMGNPAKPNETAGAEMLERMNEGHYPVTTWALDFWHINDDDKILDIGCGGGLTLKRMSEKVISGHLTGLDYSEVSVEESTKMNAEDISKGKMNIVHASVEDMPFEDNAMDKIITVESFYFWPNPVENLKEVRRVLKKNGTFLLVVNMYDTGDLDEESLRNVELFKLYNPTAKEYERLMKEAGFDEVIIHTAEGTKWLCAEGRK